MIRPITKEDINNQLDTDVLEASRAFELEETKDIKRLLSQLISTYKVFEEKK